MRAVHVAETGIMSAQIIGTLIDCGITFMAGLIATLWAFRIFGKPIDSSEKPHLQRLRDAGRVAGPLLMVLGVARFLIQASFI